MTTLLGALTIGLILSLLAFGVYISFRLYDVADITVDGSFTLGAAVVAVLLVKGWDPVSATLAAAIAGAVAGLVTGLLQTKCGINGLLSGILVMTALYSVNLRVMGKSNIAIPREVGFGAWAEKASHAWLGDEFSILGWAVDGRDVTMCLGSAVLVMLLGLVLYAFFRTNLGTAMRASGDNPQMVRALGVSVDFCRIFGLSLSNGLVGLSGALFCQYLAFADAQMGIGMVVTGLASVIIGEALTSSRSLGLALTGAVMGSVFFRLLVAIAMSVGNLQATDLKLVTALCLFIALALPKFAAKMKRAKPVPAA
ncbi:MAG TPA: ABC transporter permease [Opitutales bacterium]|nr:ABC transporter permease [Opitutales bacterium]